MQIETYLNGIFPRSNAALEAGSKWLRGRETKESYEKLLEKETIELIELQKNLRFDYSVDGQLFWNDFLRPIAAALQLHQKNSSADENPVSRQVFTNTFYRQPQIFKRLEKPTKPLFDTQFLTLIPEHKRKIILPSPFALVYLSDGIHKKNGLFVKDIFVELLFDFAKIINNEIKQVIAKEGISFVQFNDPCLAYAKESRQFFDEVKESLQIATQDLEIVTSIHLYNGDASKLLPELNEFPVQRIGVDTFTTNLNNLKNSTFKKFLEAGIVAAKNSRIEAPELLVRYATDIIDEVHPKGFAIVPNRPTELLPRDIAIKKMENMSKAALQLKGVVEK